MDSLNKFFKYILLKISNLYLNLNIKKMTINKINIVDEYYTYDDIKL